MRSSAAPTRLVVCGGDGIISLALQSLALGDIPLGIIPAGTGNDHAREYRLPRNDPEAAADVVADGWTETVDLGRIDNHAGTTEVVRHGDGRRFRLPGQRPHESHALAARPDALQPGDGRRAVKLRPLPFRLAFDDGDEIVADLTLAAFGNTKSYGGGMLICPDADHADGQLDITMVHATSRTRLIRLFPTVFKGTHVDLDRVTTARAHRNQRRLPRHQRLRRR